jgi:rubrerythrin
MKHEDTSPRVSFPFGFKGKKYTGQSTEKIVCPKCKCEYEVSIIESMDPDYEGYCHAMNPSRCPNCNQKFWYRDGFEKK